MATAAEAGLTEHRPQYLLAEPREAGKPRQWAEQTARNHVKSAWGTFAECADVQMDAADVRTKYICRVIHSLTQTERGGVSCGFFFTPLVEIFRYLARIRWQAQC